MFRALSKMTLH